MSNAVIKGLKYMNDISNSNLARNADGILSRTEVNIPIDWRDENSQRIPSQELKTSHKYFSDAYLPNEVWFETVKRLAFIDAINFSVATEKFYQIVWENKKYKKVMWLSKFLVNFDEDYFEFIENNLKLLIKLFLTKFNDKIIKNSFILNIIDLKVQKTIYQLLPFRIFCHHFFYGKGSKTAGKYLICQFQGQ